MELPVVFGAPADIPDPHAEERHVLEEQRDVLSGILEESVSQETTVEVARSQAQERLDDLRHAIGEAAVRLRAAHDRLGELQAAYGAHADALRHARRDAADAGRASWRQNQAEKKANKLAHKYASEIAQLKQAHDDVEDARHAHSDLEQRAVAEESRLAQLARQAEVGDDEVADPTLLHGVKAELERVVARLRVLEGQRDAGASAETVVAERLSLLPLVAIVHGLDTGHGDVDHVVIGPCLAAIETKHARGPIRINAAPVGDAEVLATGKVVRGSRREPSPIGQARAAARYVTEQLGVDATPILVLSHGELDPVEHDGVWVTNADGLEWVLSQLSDVYPSQDTALRHAERLVENAGSSALGQSASAKRHQARSGRSRRNR